MATDPTVVAQLIPNQTLDEALSRPRPSSFLRRTSLSFPPQETEGQAAGVVKGGCPGSDVVKLKPCTPGVQTKVVNTPRSDSSTARGPPMRPQSRLWLRVDSANSEAGTSGVGILDGSWVHSRGGRRLQPIDHVGYTGGNPTGEISGKVFALSEQPVHRKLIAE